MSSTKVKLMPKQEKEKDTDLIFENMDVKNKASSSMINGMG